MTRKDFELIACAIRDARKQGDDADTVASILASRLYNTNDRFDSARFIRACGGEA